MTIPSYTHRPDALHWTLRPGLTYERLGFIPEFLSTLASASAREQIHAAYAHGGGWSSFSGFSLHRPSDNPLDWSISYPGDPSFYADAFATLRYETLVLFPYDWLAIVQPTGEFDIARLD